MSHRPHFYVRRIIPAEPGESPNAYVPYITVEIRCFWPYLEKHKVREILDDAYREAIKQLEERP